MTEIIIDAFTAPDVYLVNPRKPDPKRVADKLIVGAFDLCMMTTHPSYGHVGRIELERWARGINVRMWSYMMGSSYHDDDSINISSWEIKDPECFDLPFFEAADTLCQKYGLAFSGMLESVGFLL